MFGLFLRGNCRRFIPTVSSDYQTKVEVLVSFYFKLFDELTRGSGPSQSRLLRGR